MLIFPYRLVINFTRVPYLNWALIAVTCVMYPLQMTVGVHSPTFREFVLQDWDLMGMIGSLFLHGGIIHLLGNMIFLWVFGNAICSTVGNAAYLPIYLLLGVGASAMHLAFSGAPAIGASGAISGIMGMSLILFPVSPLKCGYLFFLPFFGLMRAGKFTARAFWMISFWLVFDIVGVVLGGGGVAYWAHIGGFAAGMLVATAMVGFDLVATFDPTLADVIKGRAQGEEFGRDVALEQKLEALRAPDAPTPAALTALSAAQRKVEDDIHRQWTQDRAATPEPALPPTQAATPLERKIAKAPERPARNPSATPHVMKFRILQVVRKPGVITAYFVNQGDEVTNLAAAVDGLEEVTMHPQNVLRRGDSGWLSVKGAESPAITFVTISYDDGTGKRVTHVITLPPPSSVGSTQLP